MRASGLKLFALSTLLTLSCSPRALAWGITNAYQVTGTIEEQDKRFVCLRKSQFALAVSATHWFIRIDPQDWPTSLPYPGISNGVPDTPPRCLEAGSEQGHFSSVCVIML